MQRSTFALGIAAALLVSGFAQAEEVRKVEVAYSDLDLARTDHANALYWRIQRAARDVCESTATPASRALLIERKCVRGAVDEAIHRVDNPNLTAVYLARNGKRAMVASNR